MKTLTRTASWDKVDQLRKQRKVQTFATLGLVALGPVLAVMTYVGLGPAELDPTSRGIRAILLADLVYVLIVAALILQKVARLISSRREKSAGSQLHLRLTGVFALVALIPTVLVAVFAVVTLNFGLEGWFSDRVRNVVGTSLSAAQAYEEEQRDDLREDTRRLSEYVNLAAQASSFISDSDIRQILSQAQELVQRGLKEAYIIDGSGDLRARGERSYLFDFELPELETMERAQQGELVIIEDWNNNEFRALIRLSSLTDRFLYLSRAVDGEILSLLDETQATVRLYQQLEDNRGRLLFEFGLIYLGFAVILILAAIWLGLWFAERLSRPVGRLAGAAQRVGAGDLDVQVLEAKGDDEIAMLGRLFNQMTRQLKGQREALISNTEQIERRRRLFDSVLSSVTAGVIGLDRDGKSTLLNKSALRLLKLSDTDHTEIPLQDIAPEFVETFEGLRNSNQRTAQREVKVSRRGQIERLLVRMAVRQAEDGTTEGYVVAFDDVTDLVSAQKMAAWGDVARRIAHEIKNPLTPIKLSAEQIKRKFDTLEEDDRTALNQYADMIIRQTNDLSRIVDEFSKFARMPEPERRETDMIKLVSDAVVLQRSRQADVVINLDAPEVQVMAAVDPTMMSQAMTNLIKNAGEAIETYVDDALPDQFQPEIRVFVELVDDHMVVTVADNGIGLPEDRARLFEPYVTSRSQGTGLGLPIVKKIVEEHGGTLALRDAPSFDDTEHFGAEAVIQLPMVEADMSEESQIQATLTKHVA